MLRAKARKKKQGGNDDFDDDLWKKEKEKDTFGGRKKMKKRKSGKDGSLLKDVVAIGILICFFLFVVSLYFKEPRGQKVFVKTKTEKNKKRLKTKVIAIGDVHGDEDVLRRLLFATGATDKVLGEDVKWVKERNERTVLVQRETWSIEGRIRLGVLRLSEISERRF